MYAVYTMPGDVEAWFQSTVKITGRSVKSPIYLCIIFVTTVLIALRLMPRRLTVSRDSLIILIYSSSRHTITS